MTRHPRICPLDRTWPRPPHPHDGLTPTQSPSPSLLVPSSVPAFPSVRFSSQTRFRDAIPSQPRQVFVSTQATSTSTPPLSPQTPSDLFVRPQSTTTGTPGTLPTSGIRFPVFLRFLPSSPGHVLTKTQLRRQTCYKLPTLPVTDDVTGSVTLLSPNQIPPSLYFWIKPFNFLSILYHNLNYFTLSPYGHKENTFPYLPLSKSSPLSPPVSELLYLPVLKRKPVYFRLRDSP